MRNFSLMDSAKRIFGWLRKRIMHSPLLLLRLPQVVCSSYTRALVSFLQLWMTGSCQPRWVEKRVNPLHTLTQLELLRSRMMAMDLVICDQLLLHQFLSALGPDYDTEVDLMASQRTLSRADVKRAINEKYASIQSRNVSKPKNSHALVPGNSTYSKGQSQRIDQDCGGRGKFRGGKKNNSSDSNTKRSERIHRDRCGKSGHNQVGSPRYTCTKCGGCAHSAAIGTSTLMTTVVNGAEKDSTKDETSQNTVGSVLSSGNHELFALLTATEDSTSRNAPGKCGVDKCLVSSVGGDVLREEWIFGSVASCHMTNMRKFIANYKACLEDQKIVTASQDPFSIAGHGDLTIMFPSRDDLLIYKL
ncbi:unnamed protein product, partial [Choristocarpus tenellus]